MTCGVMRAKKLADTLGWISISDNGREKIILIHKIS